MALSDASDIEEAEAEISDPSDRLHFSRPFSRIGPGSCNRFRVRGTTRGPLANSLPPLKQTAGARRLLHLWLRRPSTPWKRMKRTWTSSRHTLVVLRWSGGTRLGTCTWKIVKIRSVLTKAKVRPALEYLASSQSTCIPPGWVPRR